MHEWILILAFFLPISQEPNSQSRLQSLLDQVRSRPEEERDSLYYELYAHYKYNHPDSARQYALKVHELSRKYNHREVYVKSLHALGFFAREAKASNDAESTALAL